MSQPPAAPAQPLRVLFVCTANISRSPYAERRAAHLTAQLSSDRGRFPLHLSSAGVPGFAGRAMDPAMELELVGRGGDGRGHVSRSVTSSILEEADVVVTVEFAHRLRILQSWPQHAAKIFGLHQLADALGRTPAAAGHGGPGVLEPVVSAARPDGMHWDVRDPYRRGASAARACADEIDDTLTVIVPALSGAGALRG